jgi:demethylmenaquinone methyltransferase/2-methoxy-6-polyprenyl-1,4-benzoquinol methylase
VTEAVDRLLAEQLAYYRARAPEYTRTAFLELSPGELQAARRELDEAVETFAPTGDVLEIACGPGTWTAQLLAHATTLTALDGSPEMLRLAKSKVGDDGIRFVQADVFNWRPDRAYDGVFFGFWLSHVPLERFEWFWSLVCECLKPEGRVLFVDDAFRTRDELVEGAGSEVVRRRLTDGSAFRAIKVPHRPEELEQRLAGLGWRIKVTPVSGPFFWGAGRRLGSGHDLQT